MRGEGGPPGVFPHHRQSLHSAYKTPCLGVGAELVWWEKPPMGWDWASWVQCWPGSFFICENLWSNTGSWLGAQILESQFWGYQYSSAVLLMCDPVYVT